MGNKEDPWYKQYLSKPYIIPAFVTSVCCSVCLITVGIILILAGTLMTAFSDADLSRGSNEFDFKVMEPQNPFRIIGPVFIGMGFLLTLCSFAICCLSAHIIQKQEMLEKVVTDLPPEKCKQKPSENGHQNSSNGTTISSLAELSRNSESARGSRPSSIDFTRR